MHEGNKVICVQFQKLYGQVSEENKQLRIDNGELLQGLNQEMHALQLENSRLQGQLERTERDLAGARLAAQEAPTTTEPAVLPATSKDDDLGDLKEGENIFELQIVMAELNVAAHVTTFFSVDFFDHATQVGDFNSPGVAFSRG